MKGPRALDATAREGAESPSGNATTEKPQSASLSVSSSLWRHGRETSQKEGAWHPRPDIWTEMALIELALARAEGPAPRLRLELSLTAIRKHLRMGDKHVRTDPR
jgi:hypothetical protein